MKKMIVLLAMIMMALGTSVYAADKAAEIAKAPPAVKTDNKTKTETKAKAKKPHPKKKEKMRGVRG